MGFYGKIRGKLIIENKGEVNGNSNEIVGSSKI